MLAKTYNQKGEVAGQIELPKDLFEVKVNPDLVYQVAVTQMANRRQGNANTKGRGEVSGGGKKPWRQKGTGRARQGSIRAPQWRHGGVVFGPTSEKVYGGKINKKMRRKALAMVLSSKLNGNALIMMDKLEVSQPKTKEMISILDNVRKSVESFRSFPGNLVPAFRPCRAFRRVAVKLRQLKTLQSKSLCRRELIAEAITPFIGQS